MGTPATVDANAVIDKLLDRIKELELQNAILSVRVDNFVALNTISEEPK